MNEATNVKRPTPLQKALKRIRELDLLSASYRRELEDEQERNRKNALKIEWQEKQLREEREMIQELHRRISKLEEAARNQARLDDAEQQDALLARAVRDGAAALQKLLGVDR